MFLTCTLVHFHSVLCVQIGIWIAGRHASNLFHRDFTQWEIYRKWVMALEINDVWDRMSVRRMSGCFPECVLWVWVCNWGIYCPVTSHLPAVISFQVICLCSLRSIHYLNDIISLQPPSTLACHHMVETKHSGPNTGVFNHYCTHEGFIFYRWVDDLISGASEQRDKSRKSLRSSDVTLVQIWVINLSLFLRSDSLMYGMIESTTPSRWQSQTLWLLICERLCWTQPVQTRGRKRAMIALSPPLLLFPHSFSFRRVLLLHRFGAAE